MRASEQSSVSYSRRRAAPTGIALRARLLADDLMRHPLQVLQDALPAPSLLLEGWRLIDAEEAADGWEGEERGTPSATDIVSMHCFDLCQSKTGWPQDMLIDRVRQAADMFADGDVAGATRRLKSIPPQGRPGFALGVYLVLEDTAARRCDAFRTLLMATDAELAREAEIEGMLDGLSDDRLRREMEKRGFRVEQAASNLWRLAA